MITAATFLNREQVDYLDKIGKDCFFKFGRKMSRAKILSELVKLLIDLNINFEDIDFEHESLSEGIERLLKNAKIKKV